MKTHTFQKFLWLCLLLVLIVSLAEEVPAEQWMPDAALRAAVREELGLPAAAPLTKDQMQRIVSLYLNDKGISDITGLEFATNIKQLDISQNPLTDLRPLSNLIQLTGLHFWHFPGNSTNLDLRPLASLINLEVLFFEGNGISDITPLAGLRELRELYLTNNWIEEVHSLAGLINLEMLFLEGNGVTDISPLSNLKQLRILHIKYNNIHDISPVSALNLSEFSYDTICDFSPSGPSVPERIQNRDFPSIIGFWAENSSKYDFQYGSFCCFESYGLSVRCGCERRWCREYSRLSDSRECVWRSGTGSEW